MITYDANNGKELWRKELGAPMRIAPTIAAGKLYIVNINNELLCLESSTGGIKWRHSSIREATGILGAANPAVASGMVVAGFSSGEVQALNAQSGFSMWNDVITPPTHIDTVSAIADIRARPVIDGHTTYIISHAGRTTAYDLGA
jgi:outer membrane protein assembly factor BamB